MAGCFPEHERVPINEPVQPVGRKMGIDLRCGCAPVAEAALDLVERCPILHEPRCEGMPEAVKVEDLPESGTIDISLDRPGGFRGTRRRASSLCASLAA